MGNIDWLPIDGFAKSGQKVLLGRTGERDARIGQWGNGEWNTGRWLNEDCNELVGFEPTHYAEITPPA